MQVRFEVLVNGQRACLAGCHGFGVLSVGVDWVLRNPRNYHPDPDQRLITPEQWSAQRLRLHAGGLDSGNPTKHQHLHWLNHELQVGDEITVRVLPPGPFDEPRVAPFPPTTWGDSSAP